MSKPKRRKSTRRDGRVLALQLLYQIEQCYSADEVQPDLVVDCAEMLLADWTFGPLPEEPHRQFALDMARGVLEHESVMDERLTAKAEHWSLDRFLIVDRNLMRMAMWEVEHAGTPPAVAINEAVELAKLFGNEQSPRFVNGMLDAVLSTNTEES